MSRIFLFITYQRAAIIYSSGKSLFALVNSNIYSVKILDITKFMVPSLNKYNLQKYIHYETCSQQESGFVEKREILDEALRSKRASAGLSSHPQLHKSTGHSLLL